MTTGSLPLLVHRNAAQAWIGAQRRALEQHGDRLAGSRFLLRQRIQRAQRLPSIAVAPVGGDTVPERDQHQRQEPASQHPPAAGGGCHRHRFRRHHGVQQVDQL